MQDSLVVRGELDGTDRTDETTNRMRTGATTTTTTDVTRGLADSRGPSANDSKVRICICTFRIMTLDWAEVFLIGHWTDD